MGTKEAREDRFRRPIGYVVGFLTKKHTTAKYVGTIQGNPGERKANKGKPKRTKSVQNSVVTPATPSSLSPTFSNDHTASTDSSQQLSNSSSSLGTTSQNPPQFPLSNPAQNADVVVSGTPHVTLMDDEGLDSVSRTTSSDSLVEEDAGNAIDSDPKARALLRCSSSYHPAPSR